MTSDKTGGTATYSATRIQLDYAIGKHRVELAGLTQKELIEFLFGHLQNVRLRELRSFTPIRDVLSRNGDEPVGIAETCELYRASIFADSRLDESFSFNTQAVSVCRGVCVRTLTFKRLESDEETTNFDVAKNWGRSAYVSSGIERILVLIRPPNHSRADENLVSLDYRFAKVPHERRHLITSVTATSLSRESFCSFFGDKAPIAARELIWELNTIYSRTLNELVSQADRMRVEMNKWEQISERIW